MVCDLFSYCIYTLLIIVLDRRQLALLQLSQIKSQMVKAEVNYVNNRTLILNIN